MKKKDDDWRPTPKWRLRFRLTLAEIEEGYLERRARAVGQPLSPLREWEARLRFRLALIPAFERIRAGEPLFDILRELRAME